MDTTEEVKAQPESPTIEDRLTDVEAEIATLKAQLTSVQESIKVTREVKQVIFDREGDEVKVRAKVMLKKPTGVEEAWEDITEKVANKEEILNGA